MEIEDQLKEAVRARNLARHSRYAKTHTLINSFLEQELPEAIRADQESLKILVTTLPATSNKVQSWDTASVSVEQLVWNVLDNYAITDAVTFPDESLINDYVDDVFKPYLTQGRVTKIHSGGGDDILLLTFFVNPN